MVTIGKRLRAFLHPEKRESASFTELLVNQRLQSVLTKGANAEAAAAVECSAALVSRCFQALQIEAASVVQDALNPDVLGRIGRALVLRGQSLHLIGNENPGRIDLIPSASWDVVGTSDPATWRFRADVFGPKTVRVTRNVPQELALHLVVNSGDQTPWYGNPSWQSAKLTSDLLAAIEGNLAGEYGLKPARIAPAPTTSEAEQDAYRDKLKGGGVVTVSASNAPVAGVRGMESAQTWQPAKVGRDVQPGDAPLLSEVFRQVTAACGVPATLFGAQGDAREAWRRFQLSLLQPYGRVLSSELRRKFGEVSLSWDAVGGNDLVGRSRALTSLTTAGVPLDEAMRKAGFADE